MTEDGGQAPEPQSHRASEDGGQRPEPQNFGTSKMNHENTKSKKYEILKNVFVFLFFREFVKLSILCRDEVPLNNNCVASVIPAGAGCITPITPRIEHTEKQ